MLEVFQSLSKYQGLITIIVGGFAFYLYKKQKIDHKRNAARLILQEIRYAEQQIRNSGRGERGYHLSSRLLPTNNWNDNIHLFIKDLKEDQNIDLISEFYSKAAYIDSLIIERSRQKVNPKFLMTQNPPVSQETPPSASATAQQIMPPSMVPSRPTPEQIAQMVISTPAEIVTNELLKQVSAGIEFIYNTPIVEKLRKISEKKWYQIF